MKSHPDSVQSEGTPLRHGKVPAVLATVWPLVGCSWVMLLGVALGLWGRQEVGAVTGILGACGFVWMVHRVGRAGPV